MLTLKNNLERIAQEERAYRKPLALPVRRRWYITAAAISVALVSGLASLFLLRLPPTPEEIYRNFYQTAKPIMLARSAQNLPGDTFNKDLQIFANGNYAEVSTPAGSLYLQPCGQVLCRHCYDGNRAIWSG